MYNPYNPYINPMDRIDNQIKELENLKKNYQNLPQQQPIQNIINTNSQNIDFEARILNENEKPDEILVQRKTAFIDLFKGKLSIKELNGDIKEYKIELPKTEDQLKIEQLERKLEEYEHRLSSIDGNGSTNEKDGKSIEINEPITTKDVKRVSK